MAMLLNYWYKYVSMTPDWLPSAIGEFTLGALAIVLSLIFSTLALLIAHQSNQKMASLSAYHIEEKIAMMAVHHHNLARGGYKLEVISQFRNDLKAISKLQKYITPNQQKELDRWLQIIRGMLKAIAKDSLVNQQWKEVYEDINETLIEIESK